MSTGSATIGPPGAKAGVPTGTVLRFLALACLWGSAFTLIKIALEGLSPSQLVLGRLVLGAAVVAVVCALRKVPLIRSARVWRHIVAAAVLSNALPFTLQAYGEQTTSASLAGVLLASIPLFTLAIATAALPNEAVSRRKAVGLAIGFVGVVIVASPWNAADATLRGSLACLGAALSVGAGFVYARRFLSPLGLTPAALAASQLAAAALVQAAVVLAAGWERPELTGRVLLSMLFLGAVGTGGAYVLYFKLVADIGATRTSAVSYVVPLVAVAVGAALLGESVTVPMAAGGAVVLLGLSIAEGRLGRRSRAAR